jgi:uncharacterized protein (TIGR02145 family)
MKKSILSAALFGLAAAAVLICAGCDEPEDYNKNNGSDDLNTFLGVANGKFPNTPSGVTATKISARGVTVSWSPASKAEEYYVYREKSVYDGYYDNCDTERYQYDHSYKVGSTRSTSYSDTGLISGTTYCYTVTAVNKYGETPRSREYKVTTTTAPQSPEDVNATAKSSDSVVISWTMVSDAAEYYVYRSTSVYGTFTYVGKTTSRSYTDTGLSPSTTYYYKVSASNEDGESKLSYYASCTTLKYHEKGTLPDGRDGKVYKTVKIGDQTWMAENLNYKTENSWCYGEGGETIVDGETGGEDRYVTLSEAEAQANCVKYGRLYTWEAANTSCPGGWHLPTRREWGDLAITAGGTGTYGKNGTAGKALKAASGWSFVAGWYDGNGTDDFGFSALPGGVRQRGNDNDPFRFFGAGDYVGSWWTATEAGGNAYHRDLWYSMDKMEVGYRTKSDGYSVRCLKN